MENTMIEILKLRAGDGWYEVVSIYPHLKNPYDEINRRSVSGISKIIRSGLSPGKSILYMDFDWGDMLVRVYVSYNTAEEGGRGRANKNGSQLIIPLYLPHRRTSLQISPQLLHSSLSKWCSLMFSPGDNCLPERDGDILMWSIRR